MMASLAAAAAAAAASRRRPLATRCSAKDRKKKKAVRRTARRRARGGATLRPPEWLRVARAQDLGDLAEPRPICELDEPNGETFYRVLVAWRVPWQRAPLAQFVPVWMNVRFERRRHLLTAEFGALNWYLAELKDWRVTADGAAVFDLRVMMRSCLEERDDSRLIAVPKMQEAFQDVVEQSVARRRPTMSVTNVLRNTFIHDEAIRCLDEWVRTHPEWSKSDGVLHQTMPDAAIAVAAEWGQLAMMRHLRERYQVQWTDTVCSSAAKAGFLDCLRYAVENGCPWEHHLVCGAAAKNGHLDCLEYAHTQLGPDFEWDDEDTDLIERAARGGYLDCVEFLYETNAPMSTMACAMAADGDSLECLAFLHKVHCPWDEITCTYAAMAGSLDCLLFALKNGCPWNEHSVRTMATGRVRVWLDWPGFTDMAATVAPVASLPVAAASMEPGARGADHVEMDYDVDVSAALLHGEDALAFRSRGAWAMTTRTALTNALQEPGFIRFRCLAVDDLAAVPRAENVDRTRPFLTLQSLGVGHGLVAVAELIYVLAHPDVRALEVSADPIERLPAATSQNMVEHYDPNSVGADHCQSGSHMNVHSLAVVTMPSSPPPPPPPPLAAAAPTLPPTPPSETRRVRQRRA